MRYRVVGKRADEICCGGHNSLCDSKLCNFGQAAALRSVAPGRTESNHFIFRRWRGLVAMGTALSACAKAMVAEQRARGGVNEHCRARVSRPSRRNWSGLRAKILAGLLHSFV